MCYKCAGGYVETSDEALFDKLTSNDKFRDAFNVAVNSLPYQNRVSSGLIYAVECMGKNDYKTVDSIMDKMYFTESQKQEFGEFYIHRIKDINTPISKIDLDDPKTFQFLVNPVYKSMISGIKSNPKFSLTEICEKFDMDYRIDEAKKWEENFLR